MLVTHKVQRVAREPGGEHTAPNVSSFFPYRLRNAGRWLSSCISTGSPLLRGVDRGATLLSWSVEDAAILPKPKHTMLSVLIVLFLVSYGLLALLVVEQGRTIDAQRNLIRQLFSDSSQLTKMKGEALQKKRAEEQTHASQQAQASPQSAPQAAPRKEADKQHRSDKAVKPLPQRPPRPASDDTDERRILVSI